MKDELNCSYNSGGVVLLRKSEASHSSRQYIIYRAVLIPNYKRTYDQSDQIEK